MTTFVAGGWAAAIMSWAGVIIIWAGAVMIWVGAVIIWAGAVLIWAGACSNTNFPALKMPKNTKKQSVTDRRTHRSTDTVTYGSRARDKKKK